jgi:predicted O-linked N-acetylglucosamine transferase (SPINDLY family)
MNLNKEEILKNYTKILFEVNKYVSLSIDSTDINIVQDYRDNAIKLLQKFVDCLEVTDYLLIDSKPRIPLNIYCESYFTLGTLYKSFVETEIGNAKELLKKNPLNRSEQTILLSSEHEGLFRKAIGCFNMILRVRFEDRFALAQIVSIYTQLCWFSQTDLQRGLQFSQEALLYSPDNETIHYNLAFIYQRLNRLELAIIHYKISLTLSKNKYNANEVKNDDNKNKNKVTYDDEQNIKEREESRRLILNNYNGISCIYRSIKQWPEALHYLLRAKEIDSQDPDIQNQLGVVYTEMRRTDLAETAYNTAIKNYKRSFISTDHKFFLAELYLNLGHMHSYNGDNNKSIENYNKSLQVCPNFALPFQNKIMNLSYLFDQLEDKRYIYNQHKLVNRLYKVDQNLNFKFDKSFFNTKKINIGIISGDFVDHPVSFFISTFLKLFDTSRFTITCYSECVINTKLYNPDLRFKTIKHYSASLASQMIYDDNIHILFDLAGHTAFNRLDIFANKPSPIQITYIGYPYSTGLDKMDYRITDNICDGDFSVSQEFYTERLLALPNCFLCYDPDVKQEGKTHKIINRLRDGWMNIGCFNRINKITDSVISYFNDILMHFPKTRFIFKTKALINKTIKQRFINKFDKSVRSRIIVLDCTLSHDDHLLTYNKVDFAIDTFPYSGTTTTCEALYMGVPVFSLYDSEYYFHAQNVSCSILRNSDLDFYVVDNRDDLFEKIKVLSGRDDDFWAGLKDDVRKRFLGGRVCDKDLYIKNLQNLLTDLFTKHSELTS